MDETLYARLQRWSAVSAFLLKLLVTISDLSGTTGLAIMRALLHGERDPVQLAELCDHRIQASAEQVIWSLEGNWREEGLFVLGQALEHRTV